MEKRIFLATIGLITSIAIISAVFFSGQNECDAQSENCNISNKDSQINEMSGKIANGQALLLDVRQADEFATGYAKGAILFPLDQLQNGHLPTDNKDMEIYVYCHSGSRAAIAASILQEAGFTNVQNIGSLVNWQDLGGQIVTN